MNTSKLKYIYIKTIQSTRSITSTAPLQGKRNFRKFQLPNKRGFKALKDNLRGLGLLDHRGVRFPGLLDPKSKGFEIIPEMIPELIVPDLKGFNLKPYVSYQAKDVVQAEFSPKDLFDAVYAKKIFEDFKTGALDENGNPLNPSEDEKLTPEEAKIKARMTGSDIFLGKAPEFPKEDI